MSDKSTRESEEREEEILKLQTAINNNQNMVFSKISSSVQDAIAAIEVALEDFAEWICRNLNLEEVPIHTEYEYMMLERIQKELEVINNSLTRFNTDMAQFLAKEGWGEPFYRNHEAIQKMTQLAEELKEKYSENPEKTRKNAPDYL